MLPPRSNTVTDFILVDIWMCGDNVTYNLVTRNARKRVSQDAGMYMNITVRSRQLRMVWPIVMPSNADIPSTYAACNDLDDYFAFVWGSPRNLNSNKWAGRLLPALRHIGCGDR